VLACALLFLRSGSLPAAAYQDGDFVAVSRRGQFHEVRTHWHDLLARHCPHFGRSRVVAVPVPQPQGFKAVDTYKIQFSIAGDRLFSGWLKLLGGSSPGVPMVDMTLVRVGNDIKSISAEVVEVPDHYAAHHATLVEEWSNATHWPKHLLVDFKWEEAHEVDAVPGMYVLFATALVAALVLAVSSLASHQDKLQELAEDVMGAPLSPALDHASPSGAGAAFVQQRGVPAGPPAYRPAAAPKAD